MKKILTLLLLVLVLTFVVQVLITTQSQKAMATGKYVPKCEDCYPVCVAYCLPMDQCYRPDYDVCKRWETQCFNVPCGSEHNAN
jgi:hypothetical protein